MDQTQHEAGWRPTAFISYAHDSAEHKKLVQEFGTFLRTGAGVAAELDIWVDGPRLDWSLWSTQRLTKSDFVLVIASPEYKRRADGHAPPDVGRGSQLEAATIRNNLTRNLPGEMQRVLPVVLPGRSVEEIPDFLHPYSATHFVVEEFTLDGIESLLAAFTGQPKHEMPPLGPFVGARRANPSSETREVPPLRRPARGTLLTATARPVKISSDVRMTSADINGGHYADSIVIRPQLFASSPTFVAEYNLGRAYRSFYSVAGVLDDAVDSSQTGYFRVFCDGQERTQVQARLGEPVVIQEDVTGVLRLGLIAHRAGMVHNAMMAGANLAGGVSNRLPELAWGNPTLAE
jgi:hypothetical protein